MKASDRLRRWWDTITGKRARTLVLLRVYRVDCNMQRLVDMERIVDATPSGRERV